jgi:3-hydroxybutyryl-CoA dehydrogenase
MKLAIIGNEEQQKEFSAAAIPTGVEVFFTGQLKDVPEGTDALFDLLFDNSSERIGALRKFLPAPVFVNAVSATLAAIQQPFIRINAWPGFLQRSVTEITALPKQEASVQAVFGILNRRYKIVPDLPGMVSGRIVAMIVNEAYFTFGDAVSTKAEIDTAMKLGTNYPYGPFEWAAKIGLKNIFDLLVTLSKDDTRYTPAHALLLEAGR